VWIRKDQGRGVGFITPRTSIIAKARELGGKKLFYTVISKLKKPALHIYEKLGFKSVILNQVNIVAVTKRWNDL